MSSAQFKRASLVPFDAGGSNPEESKAIPLDFNPETLTLKVSAGEQKDKGRRGRQQSQNVGASKATLSFECIFDSTRPKESEAGAEGDAEEMLDVRLRTKPIADLLQVYGSGRDQAPRRVQFRWGTLQFNGVISQHQEVFDYFSPGGVPLRSKVQLTLTEQEFRYEVTAEDAARRREAIEQAGAGARQQAAASGADSLLGGALGFDLSAGFGLELGLDLELDFGLAAEFGLSAKLGFAADIGLTLGAGIDLDLNAAIDLFGGAALSGAVGGSADLSQTGLAVTQPSPGLGGPGRPASSWAPEGPSPGSRAARLAAAVNAGRSQGVAIRAEGAANATDRAALPIRGSPPLALRRPIDLAQPLLASRQEGTSEGEGERRPRWERLPDTPTAGAQHLPGCGCRRCRE